MVGEQSDLLGGGVGWALSWIPKARDGSAWRNGRREDVEIERWEKCKAKNWNPQTQSSRKGAGVHASWRA